MEYCLQQKEYLNLVVFFKNRIKLLNLCICVWHYWVLKTLTPEYSLFI